MSYESSIIIQSNTQHVRDILETLEFEDWKFEIRSFAGEYRSLSILLDAIDNLDNTKRTLVNHTFQIPAFPMEHEETERWILENIFHVLKHEACEKFKINGEAVYYPEHGEFSNPYVVRRITNG